MGYSGNSTNRTTLELKLPQYPVVDETLRTTNRTTLELKHPKLLLETQAKFLPIAPHWN